MERAGLEPTTLAVRGKYSWDEDRRLRPLGHGGSSNVFEWYVQKSTALFPFIEVN